MREGRLFAKILRQDTSLKTIPMSVIYVTNANNGTDLQRLQDRSQWPVGVRSWRTWPSAEFSPFLILIPVVGFVCEEPTCLDQSLTVASPCWL